jgi:hypothetical protein
MSMSGASTFCYNTLYNYNLDQSLSLPFDRYRLKDEDRTARGISREFDFGEHISHYFLTYVLSNDIAPKYMPLVCYYIFLFKLMNGERDLCIGINTDRRYKEELMSITGIFVNTIPL